MEVLPKIDLSVMAGQYEYIYSSLCPNLAEAIAKPGKHVCCPNHSGKDGFRLMPNFNDTGVGICNSCGVFIGINLIAWANGWSKKEAFVEICKLLGLGKVGGNSSSMPAPAPASIKSNPADELAKMEKAKLRISSILASTVRISPKSPANLYFINRGIFVDPKNMPKLGFCSSTLYFNESNACKEYLPAIIAKVEDLQGNVGALHRTYLSNTFDSKANVANPKLLTPKCVASLSGMAIQLYPVVSDHLCLAEGVETALAVRAITGAAVWSCVSAVMLENVELPANVKKVSIFADLDVVSGRGQQAADNLAARLRKAGILVEILLPPIALVKNGQKGIDWCDVLNLSDVPKAYVNSVFIK